MHFGSNSDVFRDPVVMLPTGKEAIKPITIPENLICQGCQMDALAKKKVVKIMLAIDLIHHKGQRQKGSYGSAHPISVAWISTLQARNKSCLW